MNSLVTCDPELFLEFQQDFQPDVRRRWMYTYFTHAKIPLDVIKNIIEVPTHRLEIGMIMRHLCNRQSLNEFYSDRLECLHLNLLLHKHVLRHQWSLGNHLELTESFYPDGRCRFGMCPYFYAGSYCQCWPRVEVTTR
ncbi:unnamed protein product [Caenorhabditis brenneri]